MHIHCIEQLFTKRSYGGKNQCVWLDEKEILLYVNFY